MLVVPIPPGKLLVVLESINIMRMEQHDNVQIKLRDYVKYCPLLTEVFIGYASAQEIVKITEFVAQGEPQKAVELLCAGFSFRPDLGDNDLPPKRFMPR